VSGATLQCDCDGKKFSGPRCEYEVPENLPRSRSSEKLKGGHIAAIVISCLVVGALVALIIVFYTNKNKKTRTKSLNRKHKQKELDELELARGTY